MSKKHADLKVIVADDDEIVRGLLRTLLRIAGYQVVAETSNGERTLEAYNRYHPDIVCLDIDMPGISGLEVLTRIRALSTTTIIIVISAETTLENTQRALTEKADGFIAKPFNMARVLGEIERILRERRGAQSIGTTDPTEHDASSSADAQSDEPRD